jgi:hypothetical protein
MSTARRTEKDAHENNPCGFETLARELKTIPKKYYVDFVLESEVGYGLV